MEGVLPEQFVRVIASGSRGNATYVRLDGTGVLIDAGVPLSRIRDGLGSIGVGFDDIDGIVLSHEHTDHVRGLAPVVAACPNARVFASPGTARASELACSWTELRPGKPKRLGRVDLHPFAIEHDAAQPVQVRLETSDSCVVVATDIGHWTDEVADHFRGAHVAVLEANHDRGLLARGPYPAFLKRRIGGRLGHLSNDQARLLLERSLTDALQHVVLGHMSDKNNEVLLALETVGAPLHGTGVTITAARQDQPHDVVPVRRGAVERSANAPLQGSLF
jgi:phosphoribosyl 1,2-cyclic phosphodiesterase